MDFINNLKWYHYLIVCIIIVLIYIKYKNTESFNTASKDTQQIQHDNGPKDELILYYAMWCGYSKQFLPEWEKFEAYAKRNFPNVLVSRVRCEDGNEATCSQKGVEGYPTVILYKENGEKHFEGERTFDALVKFVQNN